MIRRVGLGVLLGAVLAGPMPAQNPIGRITSGGVARAQAVVDSVFLDRRAREGSIEGGDWASYLMVRLGVTPLPDSLGIIVQVDTSHITFTGRIQDLPPEGRAMLGPLLALMDSNTVLTAEVIQLPAAVGIAHFQLRGVTVGGFPVPEIVLRSMLMNIGDRYPALTKTGRDLFVQIPPDGSVTLIPGAVRISARASAPGGTSPP